MLTSSTALLAAFVVNTVGVQGSPLSIGDRKVDVNKFRLEANAEYITSSGAPIKGGASPAGFKAVDYVQVATNFVLSTVPNANFRLVGDHYIGADGTAHVYFKQTVHDLDIDNADFNVNVSIPGIRSIQTC